MASTALRSKQPRPETRMRSSRRRWRSAWSVFLVALCGLALPAGPPAASQTPMAASWEIEQFLKKGRAMAAEGLVEPAIVTFGEILAKDPNNVEARLELAKLALRAQNWAYAIQMFGELMALKPDDPELRRVAMEVYKSYGMEIETLQTAIELARLVPEDVGLLRRLAKLYHEHGLIPEEVQTYERLVALRPAEARRLAQIGVISYTDPEPLWKLAELYAQRRGPRDERRTYERIRDLTPDDPRILKRLARVYGEQGYYDKQIAIYETLRRQEPDAPLLKMALARARHEAGRVVEDWGNYWLAREYYREALRLDPEAEHAPRGVERTTRLLRPTLGYEFMYEEYQLDTDQFRRTHRVLGLIPLPLSGSRLRLENATILVHGGGERVLANDSALSWEQLFGRSLRLWVGASGMAFGNGGAFSGETFGFQAGGVWEPISPVTFSTTVKREQITDSPKAFERSIRRISYGNELSVSVDLLDRSLSVSGMAMIADYSDGNNGTTLGVSVEYPIFYGRPVPVEDPGLLPAEERSKPRYQLAIGYEYADVRFDRSSPFYSSVLKELIHAWSVKGQALILPRTRLSGSIRTSTDQSGQRTREFVGELSFSWPESVRSVFRFEDGDTTLRQGVSSPQRKFVYGIEYQF